MRSYSIVKRVDGKSRRWGLFKSLDDAVFAKDLLIEYNWDIDSISKMNPIQYDAVRDEFCIISVIKSKIHLIKRFKSYEEAEKNLDDSLNEVYCRKIFP